MSLEDIFFAVGQRILELRGGLTQAEFAARLGVDRKTVVGWETGKRLPDGASLLKLMKEFGANVNYILSGKASTGMALSAEEKLMLEYFRDAAPAVRKAAMAALLSGGPGSTSQVFHGSVSGGVAGNNVIHKTTKESGR